MDSVHAIAHASPPQSGRRRRPGKKEQQLLLAQAINGMSELERLVLGLRCLEAIRPRQIAAMLDLTEERVESLVESGTRLIEKHLLEARDGVAPVPASASVRSANGANGGGRH
jgi:DNA-directed RNA polymerase specialized sigma24 family protein